MVCVGGHSGVFAVYFQAQGHKDSAVTVFCFHVNGLHPLRFCLFPEHSSSMELGDASGFDDGLRRRNVPSFEAPRPRTSDEEDEEEEVEFKMAEKKEEKPWFSMNKCIVAALVLLFLGSLFLSGEFPSCTTNHRCFCFLELCTVKSNDFYSYHILCFNYKSKLLYAFPQKCFCEEFHTAWTKYFCPLELLTFCHIATTNFIWILCHRSTQGGANLNWKENDAFSYSKNLKSCTSSCI